MQLYRTFLKIIHSFRYAILGAMHATSERNMRIHLLASVIVLIVGVVLQITAYEWIAVVLCMALVISLEILNTAIERICDALVKSGALPYEQAGLPKDLSAGAVLVAAMGSAAVGVIIVLNYLRTF